MLSSYHQYIVDYALFGALFSYIRNSICKQQMKTSFIVESIVQSTLYRPPINSKVRKENIKLIQKYVSTKSK